MTTLHTSDQDFAFKEGHDVFSPKNLIELERPGSGVANLAGDLVFVPVSKYSFKDEETRKVVHIAPLTPSASSASSLILESIKGGDAFQLDSRTLGRVSCKDGKFATGQNALPPKCMRGF